MLDPTLSKLLYAHNSTTLCTTACQGMYSEAEQLCERSHATLEKALGPEHPDVAHSLSHRATFLAYQVRVKRCLLMTVRYIPPYVVLDLHFSEIRLFPPLFTTCMCHEKNAETEPLYELSKSVRGEMLGLEPRM